MKGEQILIEFSNQLDSATEMAFTPPGSKPLIYIGEGVVPGAVILPVVLGFHPRNPFIER